MTHSLPLRGQGAWAESFVAAATDVAGIPAAVAFNVAAAAVVPMLTADQALGGLPGSGRGASLLIHGAGGVTGLVLVQLAAHLGAEVIATAGSRSASRVAAAGAAHVLDSRSAQWPGQVRTLTGDRGVDLAVNALPGGAATAIGAVRDGGRWRRLRLMRQPPSGASASARSTWRRTGHSCHAWGSCSPPAC